MNRLHVWYCGSRHWRRTVSTALELDAGLAEPLDRRLGDRAGVRRGDATRMPFDDGSFDVVVSLTMLHHLPDAAAQDRVLGECRRVLRPGGVLVGSDSRPSVLFRLAHVGDTMVIVDPSRFGSRLTAAGFVGAAVDPARRAFRFQASDPGP